MAPKPGDAPVDDEFGVSTSGTPPPAFDARSRSTPRRGARRSPRLRGGVIVGGATDHRRGGRRERRRDDRRARRRARRGRVGTVRGDGAPAPTNAGNAAGRRFRSARLTCDTVAVPATAAALAAAAAALISTPPRAGGAPRARDAPLRARPRARLFAIGVWARGGALRRADPGAAGRGGGVGMPRIRAGGVRGDYPARRRRRRDAGGGGEGRRGRGVGGGGAVGVSTRRGALPSPTARVVMRGGGRSPIRTRRGRPRARLDPWARGWRRRSRGMWRAQAVGVPGGPRAGRGGGGGAPRRAAALLASRVQRVGERAAAGADLVDSLLKIMTKSRKILAYDAPPRRRRRRRDRGDGWVTSGGDGVWTLSRR